MLIPKSLLRLALRPYLANLLLDIKRDEQKFIKKYKARIVAKGFRQLAGRDYDDVFAPTAQHVTLRVLLAVASSLHLEVDQLDVKTAFHNGDLSEEIYIKLPPELGSKVWRLYKALHGLKQAARAWFAKLRNSMLEHGLTPSKHEPCLFFRGTTQDKVYVMVHVDDSLIVGARAAVDAAKADMAAMFEVKDLGSAKHFLGLAISRRTDGGYSVTQPSYVENLMLSFGMSKCKPTATPMVAGLKLSKDSGTQFPPDNMYSALVGSLLYSHSSRHLSCGGDSQPLHGLPY